MLKIDIFFTETFCTLKKVLTLGTPQLSKKGCKSFVICLKTINWTICLRKVWDVFLGERGLDKIVPKFLWEQQYVSLYFQSQCQIQSWYTTILLTSLIPFGITFHLKILLSIMIADIYEVQTHVKRAFIQFPRIWSDRDYDKSQI